MSVGPLGMAGSSAGSQLAQSHGSDVNRTQQDTSDQARQVQNTEKAESASGVGQTEQDEEASDRDADGRRPWELEASETNDDAQQDEAAGSVEPPQSKDATGQRGNHVDLSG